MASKNLPIYTPKGLGDVLRTLCLWENYEPGTIKKVGVSEPKKYQHLGKNNVVDINSFLKICFPHRRPVARINAFDGIKHIPNSSEVPLSLSLTSDDFQKINHGYTVRNNWVKPSIESIDNEKFIVLSYEWTGMNAENKPNSIDKNRDFSLENAQRIKNYLSKKFGLKTIDTFEHTFTLEEKMWLISNAEYVYTVDSLFSVLCSMAEIKTPENIVLMCKLENDKILSDLYKKEYLQYYKNTGFSVVFDFMKWIQNEN